MSAAAAVRRLETMLLIRAYEEKLAELQRAGAPGTCTSVGQEACAVGVVDALDGARPHPQQPPQRWAPDRPWRRPRPPDGRGAGARRRLLRRPQRQPAHFGEGTRRRAHLDHRRRRAVDGARRGARAEDGTGRAGRDRRGVLRRRRGLRRHLPRIAQSRRAMAAAAAVRLREQRLAGLRAPPRDHARQRDRRLGGGPRPAGCDGRRQRRRGGACSRARSGRSDPRGRAAAFPRARHLPAARTLRTRRSGLRRRRRTGPLARTRSPARPGRPPARAGCARRRRTSRNCANRPPRASRRPWRSRRRARGPTRAPSPVTCMPNKEPIHDPHDDRTGDPPGARRGNAARRTRAPDGRRRRHQAPRPGAGFRRGTRAQHPAGRGHHRRHRGGRRRQRPAAGDRPAVRALPHLCDGCAGQQRRQAALPVGRAVRLSAGRDEHDRQRLVRRRAAQPQPGSDVCARAGPEGGDAVDRGGLQGPAQGRHPRRQSGAVLHRSGPAASGGRRARRQRASGPARPGRGAPRGQRRDAGELRQDGRGLPAGGRAAAGAGHRCRGDRPAHAEAARRDDGAELAAQDRAAGRRHRSQRPVRHGGGTGCACRHPGIRRPARTGGAADRAGRAGRVLVGAGAGRAADRRGGGAGGAGHAGGGGRTLAVS